MTLLDQYTIEEIEELRAIAAPEEREVIDRWLIANSGHSFWEPLPHQQAPPGDWFLWLLLAGRGSGKTDAAAHYFDEHVKGPPCIPEMPGGHRIAIIAPTLGDGVEACVNGPSGLKVHNPDVKLVQAPGGTYARWPSGAEAKLFGTYTLEDIERLRAGGNRCAVWAEELAAWRYLKEGWEQMEFGLRVGPRPHVVASTTPKNRAFLRDLISRPNTALTKATTDDNPFLAQQIREKLFDRYGGTRLGRQELYAELLDDLGTMFQRNWFEIVDQLPPLNRSARYWDLAATPEGGSNTDPDWTAGAHVAYTEDNRYAILDMRRIRESAFGVEQLLHETAHVDGQHVPIGIEQEPGSSGKLLIAHLREDVLSGFIVKGYRPTGPKEARAQIVQGAAEQGRVLMLRAPWNLPFLDELEEFGGADVGAHDDQVDAVSGSFQMLRESHGGIETSARLLRTARIPGAITR